MSQTQDTSVILVCAGNATRMQGKNKILLPLGDTNVIGMSMRAFEACPRVAEIIVVARPADHDAIRETAEQCGITKFHAIVAGGSTRQESVMCGLRALSKGTTMIAVHDGARPLDRRRLPPVSAHPQHHPGGGHGKGDGQCCSLWSGRGPHAQNDIAEHLRCGPPDAGEFGAPPPMFMCWPKGGDPAASGQKFSGLHYGPGGRASLLNRSHSTGARCPAYIEKAEKTLPGGEWAASFCKRRGNRSQRIRHSEICGKITIRTRPMVNSMVKGSETFAIRITGDLGHGAGDKQIDPNGGVTKPTARFTTIMMPKWTRSTPMAVMTGAG